MERTGAACAPRTSTRPRTVTRRKMLLLALLACTPETVRKSEPPPSGTADSAGDTATSADPVDADGDGFLSDTDCDDADPAVFPGAEEICNGRDDDCDDEE